jgi:hypothetical protein
MRLRLRKDNPRAANRRPLLTETPERDLAVINLDGPESVPHLHMLAGDVYSSISSAK